VEVKFAIIRFLTASGKCFNQITKLVLRFIVHKILVLTPLPLKKGKEKNEKIRKKLVLSPSPLKGGGKRKNEKKIEKMLLLLSPSP